MCMSCSQPGMARAAQSHRSLPVAFDGHMATFSSPLWSERLAQSVAWWRCHCHCKICREAHATNANVDVKAESCQVSRRRSSSDACPSL
jgi:hypothetical protein